MPDRDNKGNPPWCDAKMRRCPRPGCSCARLARCRSYAPFRWRRSTRLRLDLALPCSPSSAGAGPDSTVPARQDACAFGASATPSCRAALSSLGWIAPPFNLKLACIAPFWSMPGFSKSSFSPTCPVHWGPLVSSTSALMSMPLSFKLVPIVADWPVFVFTKTRMCS